MGDDGGSDLRGVEGVRRLAELAALELTDEEAERLAGELEGILEAVRGGAEERGGAEGARSGYEAGPLPLRPDEHGADPLARAPAEDAPGFEDGFFTVPRLSSHAEDAEERGDAEPPQ